MMNEEITALNLEMWSSTYNTLTAQRLLERFKIHLDEDEWESAIHNPHSAYFQLLRIPIKNLLNGIIMQQAHDYQVYAQKLFVDYLLSGQNDKDASSPGANTREDMEQARLELIKLSESFDAQEMAHQTLISDSQKSLIKFVQELQKSLKNAADKCKPILGVQDEALLQKAIRTCLIYFKNIDQEALAETSMFWDKMSTVLDLELSAEVRRNLAGIVDVLADPRQDLDNILLTYLDEIEDMGVKLRASRREFYDMILKTTELINLLPDYVIDEQKDLENRSSLYFDSRIGGE